MQYKNKRRIQKLYQDKIKRKKDENRIFFHVIVLALIIGIIIIISSYIGDPLIR